MMQSPLVIQRVRVGNEYIDVRQGVSSASNDHMVFIHGIGVSGQYFVPLAEKYAGSFNVHVIDMPGYGATPKPKTPLTLAQMADVIAGYLNTQGIEQATLVGQSMGCQTAVHFATRHPRLCQKIILIAPTVNKQERNIYMQAIRLFQDTFFETLRANAIIFKDYLRMGFLRYLITTRYMVDDRIEIGIRQLQTKVLIIRGSNDPIVPNDWIEYLAVNTKDATTVQIPRAGHLVHFTKPDAVLDASRSFLNQ